MVERLFLAVPRGCLQFVIVVFPDHTHLLFLKIASSYIHIYRRPRIHKLTMNVLSHRRTANARASLKMRKLTKGFTARGS